MLAQMKQKGAANFLAILGLAILVLVIPLTVKLVEQRQELRKSAETYPPQTVCGDNSCDGGETCSGCPGDCGDCPVTPTSPPALPGGSENWKCPGANCDRCGYAGWWGDGCDDFCTTHPNDGSCSQKNVPGPLTACGSVANQCAAGSGPVRDCSQNGKIVVRDCGNDGCYHNITTSEDCAPVVQLPTTSTTTEEQQEIFKIIQTDAEKRCEALLGAYAVGSPVWTDCVSEQKESIIKELTEEETRFNQQLAIAESICQKQGADANERMWDNCFNRYVSVVNNDFNLDPTTGQKYLRPEAVMASGCQGIAVFSNDPLNYYDCQNGSKENIDTPTRNLCQTDTGLIDYNVCQSFLSEVKTRCQAELDRGDLQGERCRDVQSAILKTEIETEQTRQEKELAKRGDYCGDTGRGLGIAACLSDTAKQIIKGYNIETDREGKPTGTLYLEPDKAKKIADCFSGSPVSQDDFNNWYSCFGGIKLTEAEAAQKLGVTSLPTVNVNQQMVDSIIKPGSAFYANFVQAVADKDKGATTFWVKDEQGKEVPVTIQIGFGEAGTDGYLIAMGGRFLTQGKLSDIQTDFDAASAKADEIKATGFDPNVLALINQGALQKTGLAQGSVVPSYKPYDPNDAALVAKYGVDSEKHVVCVASLGEAGLGQAEELCAPEKVYLEENYAHVSGAGVSVATNIDSAKRAYVETSVMCGVLAEQWNEDCQGIFLAKVGGDLVSNQNAVKHAAVVFGTGVLPLVPVVIAPAHAVPPVAFILDTISFVGSTMAFSAKEEDQRYAAKVLLEDKFGQGITAVHDVGTYSVYDLAQKAQVNTSRLGDKDTIDNRYLAYTMYITGFNLSGVPGPTPKPVIEVTDPGERQAILNGFNLTLSEKDKLKSWDEMVQFSMFRDDMLAYQKKALQSGSGVVYEEKEAEYRQALVNNAVMGAVTVGGMSLAGKGLGKAVDMFVTSRATQTIEREVAATRWARLLVAGKSEQETIAKVLGQEATAKIVLTDGRKVAVQTVKDNLQTYTNKIAGVILKDDHQLAVQAVNEAAKGAGLLERFSPGSLAKKVDLDALGEGKVVLIAKAEVKVPALPVQPAAPAEPAVPAVPEAPKVVAPPKYGWSDRLPIIGTNEPGKIEQAAIAKLQKETIPENQLDDAINSFLEQNGYRQGSLADGAKRVRDALTQAKKEAIAQAEAEQARLAVQPAAELAGTAKEQLLTKASNLGVDREIANQALDEATAVLQKGGSAGEAVDAARRKFLSLGGEVIQEDEFAQIAREAVAAARVAAVPAPLGVPQAVVDTINNLPAPLRRPARGLVIDLPTAIGGVSQRVGGTLENASNRYLVWSENFNKSPLSQRIVNGLSDATDRVRNIFKPAEVKPPTVGAPAAGPVAERSVVDNFKRIGSGTQSFIQEVSDRYAQWADNFNAGTGPRIGQGVRKVTTQAAESWNQSPVIIRIAFTTSTLGLIQTSLVLYCDNPQNQQNGLCQSPPAKALVWVFDRLDSLSGRKPAATPTATSTRKPTETVTPPAGKTATPTAIKTTVATATRIFEPSTPTPTATRTSLEEDKRRDADFKKAFVGTPCNPGKETLKLLPSATDFLICNVTGNSTNYVWVDQCPVNKTSFDPTTGKSMKCNSTSFKWEYYDNPAEMAAFAEEEKLRKAINDKYGVNIINKFGYTRHLDVLDAVLSILPPEFYQRGQGLEIWMVNDGIDGGGLAAAQNRIILYYSDNPTGTVDKWYFMKTIVHELTHILSSNRLTGGLGAPDGSNFQKIIADYGITLKPGEFGEEANGFFYKGKKMPLDYNCSNYNYGELLACLAAFYVTNPGTLQGEFPKLYDYMKSIFKTTYTGKELFPYLTLDEISGLTTQGTPGLSPGTEKPTQPASVTITQDNVDRLKTFPRPSGDNGRGMHFTLDMKQDTVASDIQKAKDMGVKWAVLFAGDQEQAVRAATQVWNAGMMPIVRFNIKTNQTGANFQSWLRITSQQLKTKNIPAYIQIYNEPVSPVEWTSGSYPTGRDAEATARRIFAQNWVNMARIVYDNGGYPGLQILDAQQLDAVLAQLPAGDPIWQKTWFSMHNYATDGDLTNDPSYIPSSVDEPAFLKFLNWAQIFQDRLGYVPPIIGTEGGWEPKAPQGQSKPSPEEFAKTAEYFKQAYDVFRTGVLPDGEPLPDYLFTFSPYLLGGYTDYKGFAWYGGIYGDMTDSINAVKSIPNFERKFSWDVVTTKPPTQTKTPTVVPGTPTRTQTPTITKAPSTLGGTGIMQYQETDLRPIENIQKVNLELCKQNSANCSEPFNLWLRMGQLTQGDQAIYLDDRLSRIMNYCGTASNGQPEKDCAGKTTVNGVPVIEIHDNSLYTTGLTALSSQAIANLSAALGKYVGKLPNGAKPIVILGGREINFSQGEANYISVDTYKQIMLKVVNYCTQNGAWSCNFELALPAIKTDPGRRDPQRAKDMADKLLSEPKIGNNVTMGSVILHRNDAGELLQDMDYYRSIFPTVKRTTVIECCAIETEKQLQSQIESVTKQNNYIKAISDYAKANNISIPYVIINNTIVRKDTVPIINNAGNGQILDFYKWGSPPSADKIKIPAGPQSYLEVPKDLWQQVLTAVSGSIISAISVISLLFGR